MFIAPTEPETLRAMGHVSSVPEKYGADFLWHCTVIGGFVGVQRKELGDLISSVSDGRLGREVNLLGARCAVGVLVVEGRPRWDVDGRLIHSYAHWDRTQYRGLLRSVQARGCWVEFTDNTADTAWAVLGLQRWLAKADHNSLDRRPKAVGKWGVTARVDVGAWLLQAIDGIGPVQARAIIEHFGRVPIGWTCTRADMEEVAGIGPKRVENLWDAMAEMTEITEKEMA